MRSLLFFVLAALASFGAGFAGARSTQKGAPRAEEKQAALPVRAETLAAPEAQESSPAAAKERIAAVLALGKNDRNLTENHALFLAISKLWAPDFLAGADEMLAFFKKEENPFSSPAAALAEAWMERWLEVDSAGALRFLENSAFLAKLPTAPSFLGFGNRAEMPMGRILTALARRKPDWTREYLGGLKPGPVRETGTYLLLNESAQQDPANAKLLLASLGDGADRPAALRGYIAGLAISDLRGGFATALAEPAGPLREELLQAVMRGAEKRGLGTMQEFLERIDDAPLRRKLAISALQSLWSVSRENPLPWIIEESRRKGVLGGSGGEYDQWGSAVGQAVQASGIAPAADWAATLESDLEKKTLVSILRTWTWNDPPGLRSWLAGHATTIEPATAEKLGTMVKDMMSTEGAATRAWAEALPPGALREQVRFQVALCTGAEGDLKQAAAVYDSMAASDTNGALAKQLGAVLAAQDGAAAAEWALQRPDGPARAAALQTVAEEWSQRDPPAAAEWLTQMPPGADRDIAVREYAAKAVYADPAAATEWVEQVADPAARGKAAEQVFLVWSWEDPIASRAWLRALPGVDEAWRTEFLRKQK